MTHVKGRCRGTSCLLSVQERLWEQLSTEHTHGFGRGREPGRKELESLIEESGREAEETKPQGSRLGGLEARRNSSRDWPW